MIRSAAIYSPATAGADSAPPQCFEDFEQRLVRALGATIGGGQLTRALGYPSQDAFRKAHQRGRLPVDTFELDGRRGRFATATDIAAWLWKQKRAVASDRSLQGGAS
jgi:hypothetical protein